MNDIIIDIVISYLKKRYYFIFDVQREFKIKSIETKKDIDLKYLFSLITDGFDLSEDELLFIFEKWAKNELTLLNNRIVDIQEKLHQNGYTVTLSTEQLNELIDDFY